MVKRLSRTTSWGGNLHPHQHWVETMQEGSDQVFVPSVEQLDGTVIGLGVFSTERIAMEVLKDYLKRSEKLDLISSELTRWEVDLIGQDGYSQLQSLAARICPVCDRRTFWFDLKDFSSMCYGSGCGAWIEDNIHDEDIIDCGWPPTRFLHQARSIEQAMSELKKMASQLIAAGRQVGLSAQEVHTNAFGGDEDPRSRALRLAKQFGLTDLDEGVDSDIETLIDEEQTPAEPASSEG